MALIPAKDHDITRVQAPGLAAGDERHPTAFTSQVFARAVGMRHADPVTARRKLETLASPLDPGFWQQETKDPAHVVKLAEAVLAGLPRLADTERNLALGRLGKMWTLLGIHSSRTELLPPSWGATICAAIGIDGWPSVVVHCVTSS